MKRINVILVLLLAIGLIAASVSPPAAHAVPNSGAQSVPQGSNSSTTQTTANGGDNEGDDSGRGDPGGAGDGLGADIVNQPVNSGPTDVVDSLAEFLLQLLMLMQAAG